MVFQVADDTTHVLKNFSYGYAYDLKAKALHEAISNGIFSLFCIMRRTIDFNNYCFFCAIKIGDIVADDFLAVKI